MQSLSNGYRKPGQLLKKLRGDARPTINCSMSLIKKTNYEEPNAQTQTSTQSDIHTLPTAVSSNESINSSTSVGS